MLPAAPAPAAVTAVFAKIGSRTQRTLRRCRSRHCIQRVAFPSAPPSYRALVRLCFELSYDTLRSAPIIIVAPRDFRQHTILIHVYFSVLRYVLRARTMYNCSADNILKTKTEALAHPNTSDTHPQQSGSSRCPRTRAAASGGGGGGCGGCGRVAWPAHRQRS